MTLSSEHSEFKTCPRCKGDGYEDSPPLRKCWNCKGTGRVWEKGPTKDMGQSEKRRSAPMQRGVA